MNSVFKQFPLPPSNFTCAHALTCAHKQDVDYVNKKKCGMKRTCTLDQISVNRHISVALDTTVDGMDWLG